MGFFGDTLLAQPGLSPSSLTLPSRAMCFYLLPYRMPEGLERGCN